MPYAGCRETIELLNTMFSEPFVVKDNQRM